MKHPIAIILVSAFCLLTLQSKAHHLLKSTSTIYSFATALLPNYTGTYVGTIPCTDCQGISIELMLNEDGKAKRKTFTLKQKYLGKSGNQNTNTVTGIWFLATGNKQNPKAKILQLIPNGNEDLMYFELMGDGSIKLLDRGQNQIKSKHSYTLKKQRA
jgi:uncharacterized lipoprotein NlpE involved in copper resistance